MAVMAKDGWCKQVHSSHRWTMPRKAGLGRKSVARSGCRSFARVTLLSKGIRTTGGVNYYRRFVSGSNISSRYNNRSNLESALHALNCKAKYLGEHTNSTQFRQAMSTLYQEIAVNAYPMFPDLVAFCKQKVSQTRMKPALPVLGGSLVETTKLVFGWKAAKHLRRFVHSVTHKK